MVLLFLMSSRWIMGFSPLQSLCVENPIKTFILQFLVSNTQRSDFAVCSSAFLQRVFGIKGEAGSSFFGCLGPSSPAVVLRLSGLQKRWSYLSSLDAFSDITDQEADATSETCPAPSFLPVPAEQGEALHCQEPWTSTPDRKDSQPLCFGDGRVKAWLQIQSSAPSETRSKAVQTDGDEEAFELQRHLDGRQHRHDITQQPDDVLLPSSPRDLEPKASSRDGKLHGLSGDQEEEEMVFCEEAEHLLPEPGCSSSTVSPHSRFSSSSSSLLSSRLLWLLLATAVALLGGLVLISMEPPCHRSNRMPRTFHFTLRYVNGPPPT